MKIEIDLIDTVEARVVIEGRNLKLSYHAQSGSWRWEGMKKGESDTTIAGLIASNLTSKLIDILQAHIPSEPNPQGDSWGAWEQLTESVADEVYDALGL